MDNDYSLGDYRHPEIRKRWEETLNQGIENLRKNMEKQMNERRLSVNSDGTVKGKVVIGNSITQAAAIGGVANNPVTTALDDYLKATQATPLTAEQRVSELKKKIAEYRAMLNVLANDGGTRNLADLFLVNISKELEEILAEVKKKPAQPASPQPVIVPTPAPYQPWYDPKIGPFQPGIIGPTLGPTWVGGQSPTIGDPTPPYTVCAGKTCITYGEDGSVTATTSGGILSNSNEENQ